jgi:hypothetical protein
VVGRVRKVRECTLDRLERRLVVVDDRMCVARDLRRDLRAAELVGGELFPDRGRDDGRTGQRDRGFLRHHHVVPHRHVQRGVAEARADDGDQPRDRREARRHLEERLEVERKAGEAPAHHVRNAPSVVVAQADERHAAPCSPERDSILLAHVDGCGRAGEHRRVDGENAHLAAFDPAETRDDRVGGRGALASVLRLRQQAELVPRPGIHEEIDAFARGEPPRLVVSRDPLLAAHRERLLAPPPEVGQRVLRGGRGSVVGHARNSTAPSLADQPFA